MTEEIGLADFPTVLRNIVLEYLSVQDILLMRKAATGKYLIKGFWKDTDKIITKRIISKLDHYFAPHSETSRPITLSGTSRPITLGETSRPITLASSSTPSRGLWGQHAPSHHTSSFIDLMISTKAEISGSFLLHCIDESIFHDDIDIYVHENEADKLEIFFLTLFGTEPVILRNNSEEGMDYYHHRNCIQRVENFIDPITKMCFQLVVLKILPKYFRVSNSDNLKSFECTRNIFDGKFLHVFDLRSITRRIFKLYICKSPQEEISLYYRWAKYVEKGFRPVIDNFQSLVMRNIFYTSQLGDSIVLAKLLIDMGFAVKVDDVYYIQTHKLQIRQVNQISFFTSSTDDMDCDYRQTNMLDTSDNFYYE